MKFTKIPETAFQNLQLNAGILLNDFAPDTGTLTESNILGATTGGNSFTATPTFSDFGEDVDNCPRNMKELKRLDTWDVEMSGTFVTVSANLAKTLVGAADVEGEKITPRAKLTDADFTDLWWVGDYSDKNGESNGGFVAVHMMNALNTGGFTIQSTDKGKGQFAYSFTGHYSISAQDTVPFEVFVHKGTEEAQK